MSKLFTITLTIAGFIQLFPASAKAEGSYATAKDNAAFYYNLGQKDQAERKFATAWVYFEKSAQYDAKDAKTQLAIADVCMKMNKMAPAIKSLEAACALCPADYSTQWRLVQLYFNYGQYNKVIDQLPTLHTRFQDTKGWAFMLGKSYYSTQNYGKSVEYLKISMKEDADNAEAPYLIGRMFVKMDNCKAALPYYHQSLSLDSVSQPSRLYEFAMVLTTAGRPEAALHYYQKAVDRGYAPHDDFYLNMANTMADAHKTDEAIDIMKDMLTRRPQDLGLLNGLADVCYHSGRYKEAIKYWDNVLSMDTKDARALYQIGLTYIKMGKDKDGQRLCDRAIDMDPSLAVLKHARQLPF